MAKLNQQSITTIVEEAIKRSGATTHVKPWEKESKIWRDYWDVTEGVRAMRMLADDNIPSSFEDDELRDFIQWHIEFFSDSYELSNPDKINAEVLWPNIEKYLKIWRDNKKSDPWMAGREMADDLREASVQPPSWPRSEKSPPKLVPQKSIARDLDDEVPF